MQQHRYRGQAHERSVAGPAGVRAATVDFCAVRLPFTACLVGVVGEGGRTRASLLVYVY